MLRIHSMSASADMSADSVRSPFFGHCFGYLHTMPIYDYRCSKCGHKFEALVKPDEKPGCPKCGASRAERLFSPNAAVSTDKTRRRSLAQARTKAGAIKKEKDVAHQEYMRKEMSEHH